MLHRLVTLLILRARFCLCRNLLLFAFISLFLRLFLFLWRYRLLLFFLFAGFWVLGERRKKILFGASLPFVLVFWFALTQLLDIYLAPGQLFALIGFGG